MKRRIGRSWRIRIISISVDEVLRVQGVKGSRIQVRCKKTEIKRPRVLGVKR